MSRGTDPQPGFAAALGSLRRKAVAAWAPEAVAAAPLIAGPPIGAAAVGRGLRAVPARAAAGRGDGKEGGHQGQTKRHANGATGDAATHPPSVPHAPDDVTPRRRFYVGRRYWLVGVPPLRRERRLALVT